MGRKTSKPKETKLPRVEYEIREGQNSDGWTVTLEYSKIPDKFAADALFFTLDNYVKNTMRGHKLLGTEKTKKLLNKRGEKE